MFFHFVKLGCQITSVAETYPCTLLGPSISITAPDGVVLNGTVDVLWVDIIASDGVIHVINGVLIPPAI